jgi:hypothetical protein
MQITGVRSMCCGSGVMTLKKQDMEGDKMYKCYKCGKKAEVYFSCLVEKSDEKKKPAE